MSQKERMLKGLLYDPNDEEIVKEQIKCQRELWRFNHIYFNKSKKKEKQLKKMFASLGENIYIEAPLHANFGCKHVHIGNNFYANYNLTLVDDGNIYIGDNVLIGPNVTIATANHPIDPILRAKFVQYNKDIHIGNNTWIGANSVIVPGVSIGDNVVIGAGSVVSKDIPNNVVAFGNPCKVYREVSEHDKEYFYKDEKVDL